MIKHPDVVAVDTEPGDCTLHVGDVLQPRRRHEASNVIPAGRSDDDVIRG